MIFKIFKENIGIIIILIINLLILKILCEEDICITYNNNESGCLNFKDCKYFYQDKTCINISSTNLIAGNQYYYTKDNSGIPIVLSSIQINENNGYKLIYGTKEVVQNCPQSDSSDYKYLLGDICYKNQPSYTEMDSESGYKCKKYFYKEIKDGFNYLNCLDSNITCPYNYKYYDYDTNECIKSCNKYIKLETIGDITIFRCSLDCISNSEKKEFIFKEENKNYCLDKCPSEAKYYYTNGNLDSPYECKPKCNQGHFSKDNECVSSCQNKIIVDLDKEIYSCSPICPENFPYEFGNYCLKSCEHSNNEYIENKVETYLLEKIENSIVVKKCVSDRPDDKYYIDKIQYKWVTDCKISPSGPFNNGTHCVNTCNDDECVTNDSFECLKKDNLNEYFIEESSNVCYKNCPDYLGKGFHKGKKCTSCSPTEGFYRENDKNCYSSCVIEGDTTPYYYNFGENFCYKDGCRNNYVYKSINENPRICYESCLNISGFIYQKDNICYDQIPPDISDYYYYKINNILTKYTNNIDECLQNGFSYLNVETKECLKNCENYKILPIQTKLGKCFNNPTYCINENYNYYNESSKTCSKNCDLYIVVDINGNLLTNEENCIVKCKDQYYIDEINKKCYKNCSYYKEESGKKIYVEKCDKFFIPINTGNYKCVEECYKKENGEIKYPYYNENGQCTDSCSLFSYNIENYSQPCLTECKNDEYYYKNDINNGPKICLKECDKFYSKESNKICVEHCGVNEYAITGKFCSDSNCTKDAPFFYSVTISGNNTYKVCLDNCQKKGYAYYNYDYPLLLVNQCINNCPGYIFNSACYEKCPNGLYSKKESFNKNICISNCPNKFFKNNDNQYECIDNCNDTYPFLTSLGECVKKCPINEIYIGRYNKCLTSCENEPSKFYEIKAFESDPDPLYKNYICISNCSSSTNNNFVYIDGTKECIKECDNNYYEYNNENERICLKNCFFKQNAKFSTVNTTNNKRICFHTCLKENEKNFLNDGICINGCNSFPNNTINDSDKACVDKCDIKSNFKFLQNENDNEGSPLHCKVKCDNTMATKRFLSSNYICIKKCEFPNNYVVEDETDEHANECLSKCPENKPYMRYSEGEYICSEDTCDKYYYMDTKICLDSCGDSLYAYNNEDKKICLTSCEFFKDKKLYYLKNDTVDENNNKNYCVPECPESSKKFAKLNGHCDTNCDSSEFYVKDTTICIPNCPYGTKNKDDENICLKCQDLGEYLDGDGRCVDDCKNSSTSFFYHNKDNYICLNNCSDKYVEDFVCKTKCEIKRYMNDKECVEFCPSNKRFFVETLEYVNTTCLKDCPQNYQFYNVSKNFFKCHNECKAYIPNQEQTKIAKLCLGDICNENYNYFIKDENDNYICYKNCPSFVPYYKKESEKNIYQCYKICPNKTIHFPGDFECLNYTECKDNNMIKYTEKECVEKCPKNYKIFENDNLSFCIENCSVLEGEIENASNLKVTYDNKCVENCNDNSQTDELNKSCVCPNLFYIDKVTGFIKCINSCEINSNYPIFKIDEKECTNYCEGILSLSGFECYNNNYTCNLNEKIITLTNGDKQCHCIDRYYYTYENGTKLKKCLKQNEECPSSHSMLIKETKECLEKCNDTIYNKIFGKTCVSNCPYFTTQKENKCECNGKWYVADNYDIICLTGDCPNSKNLYIEETKQCVSSCIGTGFEVYFNKTCISNCDGKYNMKESNSTENIYLEKISTKYCKCDDFWYYDSYGNEICNTDNNINSCKDFNEKSFNYKINETNQCVIVCPEEYKYSFGDQCFKSCKIPGQVELIQDDNLKICKCQKFWKNQNNKISCLENCKEGDKYINDTKECIEGDKNCPNDYPLLFNKICYKQGQCPEENNTYYNYFKEECSCKEKWYIENETVFCLKKGGDCPPDYKYLIYSTKECIKDKVNSLYEFNNVFYENCPEQTKNSTATNTCICDTLLGYYYINDGNKSICAQEKCPNDKNYIDYDKKECISSCNDHKLKLYQGICYEKCPNLTEYEENSQECQLLSIDTKITLQNLEKEMLENIVDLYARSNNYKNNNPNVGQKIVTTNGTCEFYGVNKNNKGITNQNIQSDLSYIDVSECIEKIYNSNKMKDEDDIVILKFDINKTPNNFLINPVEYKFINSRTGQELDASICEHNSIRISYPIHELINKFDKMKKNLRYLEYISIDLISNNKDSLREKIDKGKEIVEDYSEIDIFNINDKIYLDFCIAVEVDGKDLVLEDRFNYFYPLLSLCENNCTYNHTDFINERIFCDCSYKKEFDFERQYSSLELNTNEININQKGNSNIVVMKCIANLKYLKSITNNGGFLYTLIIILIEFILLFIIIFYGIKSLSNKFQKKMNSNEDNLDEQIEVLNIKTNEKKNYEDIKTSQRILDNPPKKNIPDFEMEFIPQEYLFLFFNQGQKNIIKKVERDSVPFKTGLNTRILLEKKKGVNYENINPRGPFPPGQNLLIIVDSMDDDINDYLKIEEEQKPKNIDKKVEKESNKISQKPSIYQKNKNKFSISEYDPSDENYSIYDLDEEDDLHEKGFIENIKRNQKLIRRNYDYSLRKNDSNFIEILIAEIIDKIYITNILLFTKKFDILALQLAVYFLCHTLLLVLNTLFFDIKTIKKIWREENYPGLGYYLGFGFLACIIIWIIYRMILCLLTNNDKIKEILKLIHYNKKLNLKKENNISKKYNNLMWKVKFKIAFYSVIQFLLLIFCFLYLTVFCSVYTGTKTKIFKAYGIALIEILIIKIIYAIVLAILRYVSLTNRKKGLYDVVKFMNTYLV